MLIEKIEDKERKIGLRPENFGLRENLQGYGAGLIGHASQSTKDQNNVCFVA
jgi:hypothetical protein